MNLPACLGCNQGCLKDAIQKVLATQQACPPPLSALNKSSFAFKTINERLPDILGKTVDFISENKQHLHKFSNSINLDEADKGVIIKESERVIKELKDLISDIKSNKSTKLFEELSLGASFDFYNDDVKIWNEALEQNKHKDGQFPRYYETSWLLAECYAYRRIKDSFLKTRHLQQFDPFVEQKRAACRSSLNQMIIVSNHLSQVEKEILKSSDLIHPHEESVFSSFIQLALWANKCDLSLSGMSAANVQSNELLTNIKDSLESLRQYILCDDMLKVWSRFQEIKEEVKHDPSKRIYIDLVADNSGYEIFVDLCLIHLITLMLCPDSPERSNIRFRIHLKRIPWFVSDTMRVDIDWLLKYMSEGAPILKTMAERWRLFFDVNFWEIYDHKFWTLPHDFSEMPRVAKDLYASLQLSSLIIFKGDLNYRKLTGDRDWHVLTPFHVALRQFKPSPLVTLRTLKADTVVGISDRDVYAAIEDKRLPGNWLVSGEYGLIQYFTPSIDFNQ